MILCYNICDRDSVDFKLSSGSDDIKTLQYFLYKMYTYADIFMQCAPVNQHIFPLSTPALHVQ